VAFIRNRLKGSLCALALTALSAAAPFSAQAQSRAPARPNILLILSDDNSFQHSACSGDANVTRLGLTPNLNAFAAQGACFDRAYSTAPQCAPSRSSIFAGRNPVDIGVSRFGQPSRPDVPFFSDILRKAGYWVGLEGRNHHLAGRNGAPAHFRAALAEGNMSQIRARFDHVSTFNTKDRKPSTLGETVAATLDEAPKGKPFFLYFGFNQTHRPFVSDHSDIDASKLVVPPDWPDTPEVREDYANYLSDLREMDKGFGDIMEMLKARGVADNTIVVFMGDNGDSLYRGKGTLAERGSHVPLIVRWPGVARPGSHNDALVSGVDLAPTFLEAAGLKPDPKMSGASLTPLLRGQASNGRDYMVTERGWHPGPLTLSEGVDYARAITGVRYKLIYNAQPYQPYSPVDQGGRYLGGTSASGEDSSTVTAARWRTDEERASPPWRSVIEAHRAGQLSPPQERIYFIRPRSIFELYDLKTDPFELTNLAGRPELAAIETGLREQLDRWMILNSDFLPLASDAYLETPEPLR
jgi:N-sulfoglucosamine sulfohydrolase